jgi:hypothetical protein
MTTAQGFTDADLVFCIENITDDARARLNIMQYEHGLWCIERGEDFGFVDEFTYADHAAVLAEVEMELRTKHGTLIVPIAFGGDIYFVPSQITNIAGDTVELKMGDKVGDTPDIFTAAHDALAQVKEVGDAN